MGWTIVGFGGAVVVSILFPRAWAIIVEFTRKVEVKIVAKGSR